MRWSESAGEAGPLVDAPIDASRNGLFELGAPDIQSYCSYLQETKNHVPATVNRRLQALRKFYDFAVEQGWSHNNPASDVQLLSEVVSARSRGLAPEDVERLLAAVRQGRTRRVDRDWAIIQVLLHAGLKLGELTQLCLQDVDLEADSPCLSVGSNSVDQGRIVPLEDEVCDALCTYLPKRQAAPGVDNLFVNRDGNPLSTRTVQRLLHHYARAAELDNLTTQALRYVYAKKVYENCGDLRTVAHLLGHRHLATTIRYLRSIEAQGNQLDVDNPEEA